MSKMSKAIAVLGVVAGLGVAALPLSSYAAEYSVNDTAKVTAHVDGAISITVESEGENKGIVDLGNLTPNGAVKSGNMTVTVSGNESGVSTYNLKMSATSMSLSDGSASIAAGVPEQGKSAWGYKIGDAANYTAAPVNTSVDLGPQAIGESGDSVMNVTFGASAASGQASGSYESTVTFIATVNQ